ncbi:hypothetical protein [Paenibacillus sp. QZ-Y1]|uniref:hypothetical protein n=1 Tax=Paenibacillus sp. QZ-Y1 TaxID=3414511 RepID=UPI003F7906F2
MNQMMQKADSKKDASPEASSAIPALLSMMRLSLVARGYSWQVRYMMFYQRLLALIA